MNNIIEKYKEFYENYSYKESSDEHEFSFWLNEYSGINISFLKPEKLSDEDKKDLVESNCNDVFFFAGFDEENFEISIKEECSDRYFEYEDSVEKAVKAAIEKREE